MQTQIINRRMLKDCQWSYNGCMITSRTGFPIFVYILGCGVSVDFATCHSEAPHCSQARVQEEAARARLSPKGPNVHGTKYGFCSVNIPYNWVQEICPILVLRALGGSNQDNQSTLPFCLASRFCANHRIRHRSILAVLSSETPGRNLKIRNGLYRFPRFRRAAGSGRGWSPSQ